MWEVQLEGHRDDDHTVFVPGFGDRLQLLLKTCGDPANRAWTRAFFHLNQGVGGLLPMSAEALWVRRHGPEGSTDWQRLVVGGTP